ncbi:kinesin [Pseudoscourfieldia marina]
MPTTRSSVAAQLNGGGLTAPLSRSSAKTNNKAKNKDATSTATLTSPLDDELAAISAPLSWGDAPVAQPPAPAGVPRLALPQTTQPALSHPRVSYGGESHATTTTGDGLSSDDDEIIPTRPPSSPLGALPALATLPPRTAPARPPPSPSRRPPTSRLNTPSGRALQEQAPPLRPEQLFGPTGSSDAAERMVLDTNNRATFHGVANQRTATAGMASTSQRPSTFGFLHSARPPPATARVPTTEENAVFAAQWLRVRERIGNASSLLNGVEGVVTELEAVAKDRVRSLADERAALRSATEAARSTGYIPPELHGVSFLEARLAETRDEVATLRQTVMTLEAEKVRLEARLAELEQHTAGPSAEAYLALTSRVERDVGYLTEELSHLKDVHADTVRKLEEEARKRVEAESKLIQLDESGELLTASRKREAEMEKECEDMEAELAEVTEKLQTASVASAEAERKILKLHEELDQARQSATDDVAAAAASARAEGVEAMDTKAQAALTAAIEKERATARERENELSAAAAEADARTDEVRTQYEAKFEKFEQDMERVAAVNARNVELEKQLAAAIAQYDVELYRRKALHDELVNIKGSIRVFCRMRPLLAFERQRLESSAASGDVSEVVLNLKDDTIGTLDAGRNTNPERTFELDKVFGPAATQSDVFDEVEPLVTSVLDGYNVCIFAYGQTGSGKTFTMDGTKKAPGVNLNSIERLFEIVSQRSLGGAFDVTVTFSAIEVYNEGIYDLLSARAGNRSALGSRASTPAPFGEGAEESTNKVDVRLTRDGGVYLPGLTETLVSDSNVARNLIEHAKSNRATAGTSMNEHSSRSHLVLTFTVTVTSSTSPALAEEPSFSRSPSPAPWASGSKKKKEKKEEPSPSSTQTTVAKLNLIDLAGSERVSKSEAQGERLKEATHINKSLSALGDVINALGEKAPHVPFRNSRLTHLLADSLSGNSKLAMFVNISPASDCIRETNSSLEFGKRARSVHLGPASKNMQG